MSEQTPEQKYSVYIALVSGAVLALADLAINHNISATSNLVYGFLGFAAGRQIIKSVLSK